MTTASVMALMLAHGCIDTASDRDIRKLEASIKALTLTEPKQHTEEIARLEEELAQAYEAYARRVPSDPQAPELLLKAATIYEGNSAMTTKSLDLLNYLLEQYPSHILVADVLLKKASILSMTGDMDGAKVTFQHFMTQFPEHERAGDIEQELKYLDQDMTAPDDSSSLSAEVGTVE
ncbi:MAG: hypothetical protein SF053_07220 [Bacteroidia bacterium]|nr:hypothetical protein [Bacteroidia bacterium]